jgi:hypothetical protein
MYAKFKYYYYLILMKTSVNAKRIANAQALSVQAQNFHFWTTTMGMWKHGY